MIKNWLNSIKINFKQFWPRMVATPSSSDEKWWKTTKFHFYRCWCKQHHLLQENSMHVFSKTLFGLMFNFSRCATVEIVYLWTNASYSLRIRRKFLGRFEDHSTKSDSNSANSEGGAGGCEYMYQELEGSDSIQNVVPDDSCRWHLDNSNDSNRCKFISSNSNGNNSLILSRQIFYFIRNVLASRNTREKWRF